jgi:hypothetical protein
VRQTTVHDFRKTVNRISIPPRVGAGDS